ncbi:hypothetical protein Ancab_022770 [Ancistrocladus abbreviatus]
MLEDQRTEDHEDGLVGLEDQIEDLVQKVAPQDNKGAWVVSIVGQGVTTSASRHLRRVTADNSSLPTQHSYLRSFIRLAEFDVSTKDYRRLFFSPWEFKSAISASPKTIVNIRLHCCLEISEFMIHDPGVSRLLKEYIDVDDADIIKLLMCLQLSMD